MCVSNHISEVLRVKILHSKIVLNPCFSFETCTSDPYDSRWTDYHLEKVTMTYITVNRLVSTVYTHVKSCFFKFKV